jgi:hypothetical protein
MENYIKTKVPSIDLKTAPTLTDELVRISSEVDLLSGHPPVNIAINIAKQTQGNTHNKVVALANETTQLEHMVKPEHISIPIGTTGGKTGGKTRSHSSRVHRKKRHTTVKRRRS